MLLKSMVSHVAFFFLCVTALISFTEQTTCRNLVNCPCGKTGRNITVCKENATTEDLCRKWVNCKNCQEGLNRCLECPEGYTGSSCTVAMEEKVNSRQKRGVYEYPRSTNSKRSPFEKSGVALQKDPSYGGNNCKLHVKGNGRYNCTIRMNGTYCDVFCADRYTGRYRCYSGRFWYPLLQYCVQSKVVPQKSTCNDPGFISNGIRWNMDGTQSFFQRRFEHSRPVVFSCRTREYILQGSRYRICWNGYWSDPLPRCIKAVGRTTLLIRRLPVKNRLYTDNAYARNVVPQKSTCNDPGFISNGIRWNMDGTRSFFQRRFEHSRLVVFSCRAREYTLQGSRYLICWNGYWSDPLPRCIKAVVSSNNMYCHNPGRISNGKVTRFSSVTSPGTGPRPRSSGYEEVEYPEGTRLEYSCEDGYNLTGDFELICQPNGFWSSDPPICSAVIQEVMCPDPSQVVNADRLSLDGSPSMGIQQYSVGEFVVYSCHPNFTLQGRSVIKCLASGNWSHLLPYCSRINTLTSPITATTTTTVTPEVMCPDPSQVVNADRLSSDGSLSVDVQLYRVGQSVVYSCHSYFLLKGSSLIKCLQNGEWSDSLPHCIPINTPDPPIGTTTTTTVTPEIMCPEPPQVVNADRLSLDGSLSVGIQYRFGQSVVYSCHPDFTLQGPRIIKCLRSGKWSHSLPYCRRINYPVSLARMTTGHFGTKNCLNPGTFRNGRVVYYFNKYSLTGSSDLLDEPEYPQGSRMEYSCNAGYKLQGSSSLVCQAIGDWSADRPICKKVPERVGAIAYCNNPGPISYGRRVLYLNVTTSMTSPQVSLYDPKYPEGTSFQYFCYNGYALDGAALLTCQMFGFWSADAPTCKKVSSANTLNYCGNPGSISNGQVRHLLTLDGRRRPQPNLDDSEYPQGTILKYSCNSGYILEGKELLTCESTGYWSAISPECISVSSDNIMYCDNPGPISNGKFTAFSSATGLRASTDEEEEYPEGTRLEYSCEEGYILTGNFASVCQTNEFWSSDAPTCEAVSMDNIMYCDNPGPIANGEFTPFSSATGLRTSTDEEEEYPEGTRLEYSCEDGYNVTGDLELTCQANGYWSSDAPTCDADCGRLSVQTSRLILNDTKTYAGEWPWVVAIRKNNFSPIICEGAVVNSITIVTAAHCLEDESTFTLYFGKLHRRDLDDDSEVMIRQSTQILIHPNYDNTTFDSDIALVMFDPPIRYSPRIQPICLPSAETTAKNIYPGVVGFVTGWELTEQTKQSDELLLTRLPVLNNDICMDSFRNQSLEFSVTQNMFCAGFENGQLSESCTGDSGSPLVFYDKQSDRYTLEGIVSFAVTGQCGLSGRYTVFTKVLRFEQWIFRNM